MNADVKSHYGANIYRKKSSGFAFFAGLCGEKRHKDITFLISNYWRLCFSNINTISEFETADSRVKKRSFNLPLLAKPYEPISSIRLSFGIVPFQEIKA